MPSSTFSFERVPKSRWYVTLACTVIVAAIALTAFEVFWRIRGAEANHVDDPRGWAYFRDQVTSATGKNDTLLLGSSRMQLGWSFDRFRTMQPNTKLLQLAINGGSPIPVLRDIAENTKFRGVVIVDLIEGWIVPGRDVVGRVKKASERRIEYYYENWNFNIKINFLFDNFFQKYLISRQPFFGIRRTISIYDEFSRLQPTPHYLETNFNRERNADYRLKQTLTHDSAPLRKKQSAHSGQMQPNGQNQMKCEGGTVGVFKPASTPALNNQIDELTKIVRRLTRRGARVVFVRFPTTGGRWQADSKNFPKHLYWDQWAAKVPGHWVHFQDFIELNNISLPDCSHVDKRQKNELTNTIIKKIRNIKIYNNS